MEIAVGTIINVYGKKANFDHCKIISETPKAYLFELTDSMGSYLHEYIISFWIPKSIVHKHTVNDIFGNTLNLPFWFDLGYDKKQI